MTGWASSMVAGILLLVVFADLICTIWCLGRFLTMRSEVKTLESVVTGVGELLRQAAVAGGADAPVELPNVDVSAEVPSALQDAADILKNASPDELAEAGKLLEALGLTSNHV